MEEILVCRKSLCMYTDLSVLNSSYIIALWVVALVIVSYGISEQTKTKKKQPLKTNWQQYNNANCDLIAKRNKLGKGMTDIREQKI